VAFVLYWESMFPFISYCPGMVTGQEKLDGPLDSHYELSSNATCSDKTKSISIYTFNERQVDKTCRYFRNCSIC